MTAAGAESLFREHHANLYHYLVHFCGDADVAADVAQETFVRYLERPPAVAGRGWFYRVATNLARDMMRTTRRRERIAGASPHRVPMADPAPDSCDLLVAAEGRAAITAALGVLSVKERTALLMREEGFSHREIAKAVGTTTGSVGTLLARALDRLSEQIDLESEVGR